MIRLIFSSILVLHGLLHLIGFVKEWNIGSHGQPGRKKLFEVVGNPSRTAGTLWLVASILFITATIFFIMRHDLYWIPALAGLLISQTLIIIYWVDARYGTTVNVMILVVVIFAAAAARFHRVTEREVKELRARASENEIVITEDKLSSLPGNVQRWLRKSQVLDKRNPNLIQVMQKGSMRSRPDGNWMDFQAVQYFSIDPPSFVWEAKIKAAPLIHIFGRDKFVHGQGNMLIKPMAVFQIANGSGKEVDQGSLLRYMAEMVWFPQAAASDYLQWNGIDDHRARVTMTYRGTTATGIYFFNEAGEVTGFEGQRYGDFGGIYRKETWSVSVTGYKTFDSRRIGNTSEVTWKLKSGDFHWLKLEITGID